MKTKRLIEAIIIGSAQDIEEAFNAVMAEKVSTRLQETRVEYSRKMFRAGIEENSCEMPSKKKLKDTNGPVEWKAQQQGPSEDVDYTEEQINHMISEVISKDAAAGEWIKDFVSSDNPKFAGKSKEKRKQMALAAYYAKQRE